MQMFAYVSIASQVWICFCCFALGHDLVNDWYDWYDWSELRGECTLATEALAIQREAPSIAARGRRSARRQLSHGKIGPKCSGVIHIYKVYAYIRNQVLMPSVLVFIALTLSEIHVPIPLFRPDRDLRLTELDKTFHDGQMPRS